MREAADGIVPEQTATRRDLTAFVLEAERAKRKETQTHGSVKTGRGRQKSNRWNSPPGPRCVRFHSFHAN